MKNTQDFKQGLIAAIGAAIMFSVLDVALRVGALMHADSWYFATVQIFVGGLFMICVGIQPTHTSAFKMWQTWAVGILNMLCVIFSLFALSELAATKVSILYKSNIIIGAILVAMVLRRTPSRHDVPGLTLSTLGLILLISQQPYGLANAGVVYGIIVSISISLQYVIAETHPTFKTALRPKHRMYFTGVVMVVTSLGFLMLTLALEQLLSNANDTTAWYMPLLKNAPNFNSMLNWKILLYAACIGIFIRTATSYFSYKAVQKLNTDNYLAIMAATPFVTYFFEKMVEPFGIAGNVNMQTLDFVAALMVSCGALLMVALRVRETQKS